MTKDVMAFAKNQRWLVTRKLIVMNYQRIKRHLDHEVALADGLLSFLPGLPRGSYGRDMVQKK